ncbi:hypothetical protein ACLB2K_048274 [Fragaria x ananassa]
MPGLHGYPKFKTTAENASSIYLDQPDQCPSPEEMPNACMCWNSVKIISFKQSSVLQHQAPKPYNEHLFQQELAKYEWHGVAAVEAYSLHTFAPIGILTTEQDRQATISLPQLGGHAT